MVMADNPDQASDNEKHKQDQLTKQKEGKGHWKPELASDSEEAVCLPSCFPVLLFGMGMGMLIIVLE